MASSIEAMVGLLLGRILEVVEEVVRTNFVKLRYVSEYRADDSLWIVSRKDWKRRYRQIPVQEPIIILKLLSLDNFAVFESNRDVG